MKKMKWLSLVLLITVLSIKVSAQQSFKVEKDASGNKMLLGHINEQALANDSSFRWFYSSVNQYQPVPEYLKYIRAYKDSFTVVAFCGTWCPDTKHLLPEFYKTLISAGYPLNEVTLYAVDEDLHGADNAVNQYNIKGVPTFIFLHNGQEAGRIVETAGNKRIEADIVSILDKMMAQYDGAGAAGR